MTPVPVAADSAVAISGIRVSGPLSDWYPYSTCKPTGESGSNVNPIVKAPPVLNRSAMSASGVVIPPPIVKCTVCSWGTGAGAWAWACAGADAIRVTRNAPPRVVNLFVIRSLLPRADRQGAAHARLQSP